MLAQAVRNNIKTKKNMDIRTESTKFDSLFKASPKLEDISFDELLDSKISSFANPAEEEPVVIEEDAPVSDVEVEIEDEYVIVENPNEAVVDFPIIGIELTEKLPFFRSITAKLASVYGV